MWSNDRQKEPQAEISSIGGAKEKKPYPPRRPQEYNGCPTMDWKELISSIGGNAVGLPAVVNVKQSR